MYICLCNRLTDAMIGEAVAKGARTPNEVLRRFNKRRGCSNCTVELAKAIDRALALDRLHAAE